MQSDHKKGWERDREGLNMGAQNSQLLLPDPKPVRFTVKQKLFMGFYLGDAKFNGAEAARLAGYSQKTARDMASENLAKPHIAREIKRRLGLIGLTTGEVMSRLGAMARGEISTKTVDKAGEITEVFDKRQALENIARAHGLFVDRHEIQAIQGLLIEDAE